MKNLSKKYYSLLQRYKYYTYDTLDRLLSITGHIAEEDTVNTDIFTYDVV
ncbi:MAG: hypothetical protein LBF15_02395 [Candidatus Peribacteria bacterium]|jgi:hypothetical protein|nr:hypothetical protein [Candidatus Peribacteria bacterium]